MTVAPANTGAVEAWNPDEFDGVTGLEDVGAGDVIIPRLQIVHAEGVFKDNLSGATFEKLEVILLGPVKQRIMWADEMEDGDKPLCKSPNFAHGFPNMRDDVAADKKFPWNESNFEPSQAVPVEIGPAQDRSLPEGWSSNGLPVLPCASCKFQQWGTGSNGKSTPPPCTEQHTYPVLYKNEHDSWTPALLTVQRTGIKPSRTYMSAFAQTKQPMFTVYTTIGLTQQSRGSVKYSVPTFKRGDATDRNQWGELAEQYRTIRNWIRSAPRRQDEEEGAPAAPASNVNTAPNPNVDSTGAAQATTTPAPSPTPPPEPTPPAPPAPTPPPPAAAVEDDDLPF